MPGIDCSTRCENVTPGAFPLGIAAPFSVLEARQRCYAFCFSERPSRPPSPRSRASARPCAPRTRLRGRKSAHGPRGPAQTVVPAPPDANRGARPTRHHGNRSVPGRHSRVWTVPRASIAARAGARTTPTATRMECAGGAREHVPRAPSAWGRSSRL